MKRSASPEQPRAVKVARIDEKDRFEEQSEIQLSEVNPSSPSDAFFKAMVTMKRPTDPLSGLTSFQLRSREYPREHTVDIELNFSYSSLNLSDLAPGDWLLVSLENAEFAPCLQTSSSNHIAWTIFFRRKWVLKLVKSFSQPHLSGSVFHALEGDNFQIAEGQIKQQLEVIDFLATNPGMNDSPRSLHSLPTPPLEVTRLPMLSNPIQSKKDETVVPDPEDNNKVYIHNLGDNSNAERLSYSYDNSQAPPRNAYAATMKLNDSAHNLEADRKVINSLSASITRESPSNSKQGKDASPKGRSGVRDLESGSYLEWKKIIPVENVTSGTRRWMQKAEKVAAQIRVNKVTGEFLWAGQTYSQLLGKEARRYHSSTKLRKQKYQFALAYMAKLKQEISRKESSETNLGKVKRPSTPSPPAQEPTETGLDPDLTSLEAGFVSPREHFRALSTLGWGDRVAVVGVVTDVIPPRQTRNGTWATSVKIIDPSNVLSAPFRINVFCSSRHHAPSVKSGQGILVNRLKVDRYQGSLTGTGNDNAFSWVGYDFEQKKHFFSTLSAEACNLMFPIGPEEIAYFDKLGTWYRAVQRQGPSNSNHKLKKVKTISEVVLDEFFITNLEVLKVHTDGMVVVYATDYTEAPRNLDFDSSYIREADLRKLGSRLIRIALFEEDREMGYQMEIGKIYTFSNIRLARTPKGLYFKSGQPGNSCKIDLSYDDEAKATLLQRKQQFYDELAKEEAALVNIPEERMPLDLRGGIVQTNEQPLEAGSRDVEESRREVASQNVAEYTAGAKGIDNNLPEQETGLLSTVMMCMHPDRPVTSIAAVKKNEVLPSKFRLKARMVDVRPKELVKMIKVYCDIHRRELGRAEQRCLDCADMLAEPKYSYHITVLLQDQSGETLQVGLGSDEATLFFGIDPQEAFESSDAWNQFEAKTQPWLGNFLKGEKKRRSEWYQSEQYLDLAVQTWRIEQDGRPRAVYTICETRLAGDA